MVFCQEGLPGLRLKRSETEQLFFIVADYHLNCAVAKVADAVE